MRKVTDLMEGARKKLLLKFLPKNIQLVKSRYRPVLFLQNI